MARCPHCDHPLAAGAKFCPECGCSFLATSVPAGDADRTTPVAPLADDRTTPVGPPSSALSVAAGFGQGQFVPGTVLAERFRVLALAGRGGMGEVYRADDLKLGQPIALKFLPPGLDRDPDRLERFLGEVRTARQVTHPNVCRVYDIGEFDGRHYLSMEFVDGEDLASLLRRIGRLPEDRATEIARQLCGGLQAAHAQGILHRDLKPANVMIDGRGQVKITDFGLAALEHEVKDTEIRSGTPDYMAPEQLGGEEVTVQSDIYALGLVLYELYTGKRAFASQRRRGDGESSAPMTPSTHVHGMSPAVEQTILRCLEEDPRERPGSATMVAAALPGGDPIAAALAAGETPSPELLAEVGERDGIGVGRALLLAAVILGLFGASTWWAGSMSMLHYLPLDKRPEVLIDRAQTILAELGYPEDVYQDPVDQAWGLFRWESVFDELRAELPEEGWEVLRSRPDAASFWYRQSPAMIRPDATGGDPTYLQRSVELTNPPNITAGEVGVTLDLAGNLRRLEVVPKRQSTRDEPEPDWAPLFEFANLDPERFESIRPTYQRFHTPDVRRAWKGTRAELPDVVWQVDVGSFEGRPSLFNIATPASLSDLAKDPVRTTTSLASHVGRGLEPLLTLVVLFSSIVFAARHSRRGAVDRRGAVRFGFVVMLIYMAAEALSSHLAMSPIWYESVWPILVAGMVVGAAVWAIYLAAEPIGRRVWPHLFVSLSRLLSPARISWQDPGIGTSVLVGLLFGVIRFTLSAPVRRSIEGRLAGTPPLLWQDLNALRGDAAALAELLGAIMGGIEAIFFLATLVVARALLKKTGLAVAATLLLWPFMGGTGFSNWGNYAFAVAFGSLTMFVLLRWGALALFVMTMTTNVTWLARSTDLSAWHSRPAVLAVWFIVLLTAYGTWAAIGRRRGGDGAASPAAER